MTDAWDTILAQDDAELLAKIKADKAAYAFHVRDGNVAACIEIEQKYGLYGLSPQQVSEQLHEMAQPIEGGAA
jgi:hypothetical protein